MDSRGSRKWSVRGIVRHDSDLAMSCPIAFSDDEHRDFRWCFYSELCFYVFLGRDRTHVAFSIMKIDQVAKVLSESLEDYVMSRAERRDFKALMEEVRGDTKAISTVRSLAFRMARDQMEESHQVMEWLEVVIKTLYAKESKSSNRAYFSPGTDCLNEIRSFISGASESLDICVFTITDDRIVERILHAFERGVKIRLITDDDKSEDLGADVLRLQKAGVDTVFDVTDAHMHHKFAIADGKRLLSGSYNWTRSAATKNDENIVVSNDGRLVHDFCETFDTMWNRLEQQQ